MTCDISSMCSGIVSTALETIISYPALCLYGLIKHGEPHVGVEHWSSVTFSSLYSGFVFYFLTCVLFRAPCSQTQPCELLSDHPPARCAWKAAHCARLCRRDSGRAARLYYRHPGPLVVSVAMGEKQMKLTLMCLEDSWITCLIYTQQSLSWHRQQWAVLTDKCRVTACCLIICTSRLLQVIYI